MLRSILLCNCVLILRITQKLCLNPSIRNILLKSQSLSSSTFSSYLFFLKISGLLTS
jgi:hypothetical protein